MRAWYASLTGEERRLARSAAMHFGLAVAGWLAAWHIGRKPA